jgi:hypothetical protein
MTSKPASKQPNTTVPSVNKFSPDKFSSSKTSNGPQKFGGQSAKIAPQKTWSSQQTKSTQANASVQPNKSMQQSQPKPTFQSPSSNQLQTPLPQQPTVRAPSPTTNEQWDQTNLEKGIPTPSFLVEMRKNLKKRDGVSGDGANAADGRVGGSVAGAEMKNGAVQTAADATSAISIGVGDGMDSKFDGSDSLKQSAMHSSTASYAATITALDSKSSNDQNKPSKSASAPNELSARRSRLVARANHVANATESVPSKLKEPPSPGTKSEVCGTGTNVNNKSNQRRERILAKVRANTNKSICSNHSQSTPQQLTNDQSISDKRVQSPALAAKIKVTSPHADEVEMLFANEGFQISSSSDELGDIPLARKESTDSISINEVQQNTTKQSSLMSMAVAKKSQNVDERNRTNSFTPQKSKLNGSGPLSQQQRLHMASTPKIRGNCQYRRDNFENEKSEAGLLREEQEFQAESPEEEDAMPSALDSNNVGTKQVQRRGSYSQGISNTPNSKLPFNPSPQSQTQYLGHSDDEKPHIIHQAYSLNERAPSTISAISGLSNPSCFPQDSPFGHLQQPMLGGGSTGFSHSGSGAFMNAAAIKESTSFNSINSGLSGIDRVGNSGGGEFGNTGINNLSSSPRASSGMGISAFSSGVENENRRLREQLNAARKKLEEKDAIISQLMKRIADLEHTTNTSSSAGEVTKNNVSGIRSYSMDRDSYAMSSLWDHSRPASDVYAPSSFHANRSPSADAESISMSSPPQQLSVTTIMKQSPNTTITSSTASVTTANSAKSHQRGNSSRSFPVRRSPNRMGGTAGGGDDRRFQC